MDGAPAPPTDPPIPALSVIAPALNEEENVGPLVEEFDTKVRGAGVDAELIVVDDGSDDRTLELLRDMATTRPWLRVLHRPQRQGQSAAMFAGIHAARAPFVGMMDADLQNDPADLPDMLARIQKGDLDLVQGDRSRNRRDTLVRRVSSMVGRAFRRMLLGDPIRDTGCSTRVLRTEFAVQLPLQYKGMHRFIPVYARLLGARIAEMPARHRPRVAGVAKYGVWNRALVALMDCFAVRWMRRRLRDVKATELAPASLSASPSATGASAPDAVHAASDPSGNP
jgi:glycosyltransferase involved in cell wall biosynthesis